MQAAAKSKSEKRTADSDDGASSTSTTTTTTAPSSTASFSTNLDRFLEYTTPKVPAQVLSKVLQRNILTTRKALFSFFPTLFLSDILSGVYCSN